MLHGGRQRRVMAGMLGLAFLLTPALVRSQAPVRLNPKLERRYAQLQAQSLREHGHKLAETLAKLAALDYTFANTSYTNNDFAAGRLHLAEATTHADRACSLLHAEAITGKKSGIKNVEKIIQSISFGLHGLAESVDYRQQTPVKAAVAHFTDLNYELLQWLFAPKS
ncbi:MAG: hypothetical protein ACRD04_12225 [Terriglobales bacterium]